MIDWKMSSISFQGRENVLLVVACIVVSLQLFKCFGSEDRMMKLKRLLQSSNQCNVQRNGSDAKR